MNILSSHRAAGLVTAAAFTASAAHIVTVVDQTNWIGFALAYPLGIDGLIYVGIRALQEGRKAAGLLAVFVGAVYSLLFNADAENAIQMDPLLIAASMPVCLFASFVIVHTGQAKTPEVEIREVVKEVRTYPELLPIAPFSVTQVRPVSPAPVLPVPVSPAAPRVPRTSRTQWDVLKAVHILMDPEDTRTDANIGDLVGVGAKMIQRTRRAVRLLKSDPKATVPADWKVPAAVVQVIRAEVTR